MSIRGSELEQLATLEESMRMVRRDLDRLEATPAAGGPKNYIRLARIEGSPAPGDNTFSVMFLDGIFPEIAGDQTPTYYDRQTTGQGVAHNVVDSPSSDPQGGEVVIVFRWSDRWWFEWE